MIIKYNKKKLFYQKLNSFSINLKKIKSILKKKFKFFFFITPPIIEFITYCKTLRTFPIFRFFYYKKPTVHYYEGGFGWSEKVKVEVFPLIYNKKFFKFFLVKKLNFFYKFFNFFDKFLFIKIKLFLQKFINFIIFLEKNFLSIYLKKKFFIFFFKYLKNFNLFSFKILTDLTAIDYLGYRLKKRFKIVYNLFSLKYNYRLLVNIIIDLKEGLPSLTLIFPNSNWLEREVWDMFGIIFFNHYDFRRILTDYGFKWFPMRKDFPITGYIELCYDEIIQDISYRPVKLMQEMRFYTLTTSTWENLI